MVLVLEWRPYPDFGPLGYSETPNRAATSRALATLRRTPLEGSSNPLYDYCIAIPTLNHTP